MELSANQSCQRYVKQLPRTRANSLLLAFVCTSLLDNTKLGRTPTSHWWDVGTNSRRPEDGSSKLPELAMFSWFGKNFESLPHTRKETLKFLYSSSYSSEKKAFRLAQKWKSETLHILSSMSMQWCKRRGCKHMP